MWFVVWLNRGKPYTVNHDKPYTVRHGYYRNFSTVKSCDFFLLGLDQAETRGHYGELLSQPEIKAAFERIYSEYLLEMGYTPYSQL